MELARKTRWGAHPWQLIEVLEAAERPDEVRPANPHHSQRSG